MSVFRTALIVLAMALAPAAHALDGKVIHVKIPSKNVPGPVDIAVYTPPGYDAKRAQAYPLVIQLHGGGGSSDNLTTTIEPFEQAIKAGTIPAAISVMPSVGRSFYMDYRDGSEKWEQFILTDL